MRLEGKPAVSGLPLQVGKQGASACLQLKAHLGVCVPVRCVGAVGFGRQGRKGDVMSDENHSTGKRQRRHGE